MERKVREDFDLAKDYSVAVGDCTVKEKKEVQQAFFDAGILWSCHGAEYLYIGAKQYSNKYAIGGVAEHLMYGGTTEGCNMTAEEFLEIVYEPEQARHVHADLMAQYAEDAKTTDKPWELWQVKCDAGIWWNCREHPKWGCATEYRRKPKTHTVNGVEIPDLRITPKTYEEYYFPSPDFPSLALRTRANFAHFSAADEHRIKYGLCYEISEEGRQAAVLHAKAMLGIKS